MYTTHNQVHAGGPDDIEPELHEDIGLASVEGVWTLEGENKIANPVNILRISCDRNGRMCTEARLKRALDGL